ncbi:MAG: putative zinc-binding protein [Methanomassiliicoccales archaeon]|jgi:uncharacterized metal-binding protein|nr:putative zinc-binding protein [Methanomassiliicoccales archaeon]
MGVPKQEECLCGGGPILVYACSGGSNVGQITNEVAKMLAMSGRARMSCAAGIGGHVSGIVESARAAETSVVIDGCHLACAKKSFEHLGLKPAIHVVVTDLGIKKSYDLNSMQKEEVDLVLSHVANLLPAPLKVKI